MDGECPFRAGQVVIYKPSVKGWGSRLPDENLVPNERYLVREIADRHYVLVEGYSSVGGGIYWTEFVAAEESR